MGEEVRVSWCGHIIVIFPNAIPGEALALHSHSVIWKGTDLCCPCDSAFRVAGAIVMHGDATGPRALAV